MLDVPVASFFPVASRAETALEAGGVDPNYRAATQGLNEAAAALLRASRGQGAIHVQEIFKPLANALLEAGIEARPEDTELLVALHSWAAKAPAGEGQG